MTFREDDLAKLFSDEPQAETNYGQATLTAFNPETFENSVLYRGTTLRNLTVLSSADAQLWEIGDTVLLMKWTPTGGGLSSYWIAGRPVTPQVSDVDEGS